MSSVTYEPPARPQHPLDAGVLTSLGQYPRPESPLGFTYPQPAPSGRRAAGPAPSFLAVLMGAGMPAMLRRPQGQGRHVARGTR